MPYSLTPYERNASRQKLSDDLAFSDIPFAEAVNEELVIGLSEIMKCFDRLEETGFVFRNFRTQDPEFPKKLVYAMNKFGANIESSADISKGLAALAISLKGERMEK